MKCGITELANSPSLRTIGAEAATATLVYLFLNSLIQLTTVQHKQHQLPFRDGQMDGQPV